VANGIVWFSSILPDFQPGILSVAQRTLESLTVIVDLPVPPFCSLKFRITHLEIPLLDAHTFGISVCLCRVGPFLTGSCSGLATHFTLPSALCDGRNVTTVFLS
jgi:hypothetical protein